MTIAMQASGALAIQHKNPKRSLFCTICWVRFSKWIVPVYDANSYTAGWMVSVRPGKEEFEYVAANGAWFRRTNTEYWCQHCYDRVYPEGTGGTRWKSTERGWL